MEKSETAKTVKTVQLICYLSGAFITFIVLQFRFESFFTRLFVYGVLGFVGFYAANTIVEIYIFRKQRRIVP